jgi:hypothetical protein
VSGDVDENKGRKKLPQVCPEMLMKNKHVIGFSVDVYKKQCG